MAFSGLWPNGVILIRGLLIRRSESKIKKRIWFTWANHFIFDSDSFWFTIHFDLWFNLILFNLIRFDFDSSRITIYSRIMIHLRIRNQTESKIKGRWIVIHSIAKHWLIWFRIKNVSILMANFFILSAMFTLNFAWRGPRDWAEAPDVYYPKFR